MLLWVLAPSVWPFPGRRSRRDKPGRGGGAGDSSGIQLEPVHRHRGNLFRVLFGRGADAELGAQDGTFGPVWRSIRAAS
jgi:hypothetical protein